MPKVKSKRLGADRLPETPSGKLSPGPGRSAWEVSAHQRARIRRALVEVVGKRGYKGFTVREVSQVAGVSTRAFYELFGGREECFLDTYDYLVQAARRRIAASQPGESDWRERLRIGFRAFAREIEREPQAARLILVEAYSAGRPVLRRTRRTEGMIGSAITESFASAPVKAVLPGSIVEGVVAGLAQFARAQLMAGKDLSPDEVGDAMMEWALCFRCGALVDLIELDRRAAVRYSMNPVMPAGESEVNTQTPSVDERSLFISAVAKLATAEGLDRLSIPRILIAAGLSRRSFSTQFSSAEECFLASLESRVEKAIARALVAKDEGLCRAGGQYRAVTTLCVEIARDPLLAKIDIIAVDDKSLRFHERLAAKMSVLIFGGEPLSRPSELHIEASIGAIWGIIVHRAFSQRIQQLPEIAATLAALALIPVNGAPAAIEAIEAEQARLEVKSA